jgi:small-conductance mechanosensitive channel
MQVRVLEYQFYHNSLRTWLVALAILTAGIVLLYVIRHVALKRFEAMSLRTASQVDDVIVEMIKKTRFFFLLLVTVAVAARVLDLPPRVWNEVDRVAKLSMLIQIALWLNAGIRLWVKRYATRKLAVDPSSVTALSAMSYIARIFVWALILIFMLDVWGVNVTTVVAGLGVTGIAVALAVQNILSDMLSALSIVTSKPFVVGETIGSAEFTGTVRAVGLRSTRLTSTDGEELIIPNKKLLDERLKNFSRQTERRVTWPLRVSNTTPQGLLARVPVIVREVIEAQAPVRFDRCHFKSIGEAAFEYETSYVVLTPDFNRHMEIRQAINLGLLERFAAEKIEIAWPTRTVVVRREDVILSEAKDLM